MSKFTHGAIQVLAVGVALAVASRGSIPVHYREVADAAIALLQAVLAMVNHGTTTTSKV